MDIARDIAIFNRIKDEYIRDAREHKVNGNNILDWLREHLTEEEYNSAGDLGFTSREDELAYARRASHIVRKSQTVQDCVRPLNRIGSRISGKDGHDLMHALGQALADGADELPETPDGLTDALLDF